MAYSDVILGTTGLVSYWRLGEASGNPQDSKGTNHVSVVGGTPTRGAAGAIANDSDKAITFNGSTDYIQVPDANSLDFGDGPFSIEFWAKRSATGGVQVIWWKSGQGDIYVDGGGTFWLGNTGADIVHSVDTTTDTTLWHHFVASRSGAGTGNTKIYRDGIDITVEVTISATTASNASDMAFGYYPGAGLYYAGSLDELAIYNVALTAAQVSSHWTSSGREQPLPDTHASGMANGLDASTLGNRFTAIKAGSITHIRHWHTAGDGANTHYLQLYDGSGTKVASVDDACGGAPTGWRMVPLATPLAVAAGATFTVAIHTTGWYYTYYIAYPIASTAPSLTSAGSWNLYGLDGYPTAASAGTYLIDVVFVPDAAPAGPPPSSYAIVV